MLKFGPLLGRRLVITVAEPWAPTTDSVWQREQRSRNSTAPWWYGLELEILIGLEPHPAASSAPPVSAIATLARAFMRGGSWMPSCGREYIERVARAGAQKPCAVLAARSARNTTTSAEDAITPISRR